MTKIWQDAQTKKPEIFKKQEIKIQDYTMFAFDKKYYNTEDVKRALQSQAFFPATSYLWLDKFMDNETVCVFTKDESTEGNNELDNKTAFKKFVKNNLDNPKFENKYLAFVNGQFQNSSYSRSHLVKQMYEQFGNTEMYVEKFTTKIKKLTIDTPEI